MRMPVQPPTRPAAASHGVGRVQADAVATLAPEQSRALQPRNGPIGGFVGQAKLGRERLPGLPEAARAVGCARQRMQHVEQAVRGVRQGEPFGPRPLRDQTGGEMCGDAPGKARIRLRGAAEGSCGVDDHQARRRGDRVAMVMAFEEAGFGECVAGAGPVQDEASPLGRGADEFQRSLAHEDEAQGGIAGPEQRLAAGQAAVAASGQGAEKIGVHMTAVIPVLPGWRLPAWR